MDQLQSSLGGRTANRLPGFNSSRIGKVTSTANFHKYGRIDVIFLDYSVPVPVWVFNDVDREPIAGDSVLIGYMDGRKDAPYLIGFLKNQSYTTNFSVIGKKKIKLQLPVFGIDEKGGKALEDAKGHLLDNSKQKERAYMELSPLHATLHFPTSEEGDAPASVELTKEHALITFPTSDDGSTPAAVIKITRDGVDISHPKAVTHNAGDRGVARLGDEVEVSVAGIPYKGKITSASERSLVK